MVIVPTDEQAKKLYLVACGFEPDVFPLTFVDLEAMEDFIMKRGGLHDVLYDHFRLSGCQTAAWDELKEVVVADSLEEAGKILEPWGGWGKCQAYQTPEDCAWAVREYWKDICKEENWEGQGSYKSKTELFDRRDRETASSHEKKETQTMKRRDKLEPIPLTRIGGVIKDLPVEYHHFRVFNRHEQIVNNGGATIATCPLPKEVTASHRYAVAICSPDDQFSRPEGRRIALRRLRLQCSINECLRHINFVDPPMDGKNIDRSWLRDLAERQFDRVIRRKKRQGKLSKDFPDEYCLA